MVEESKGIHLGPKGHQSTSKITGITAGYTVPPYRVDSMVYRVITVTFPGKHKSTRVMAAYVNGNIIQYKNGSSKVYDIDTKCGKSDHPHNI